MYSLLAAPLGPMRRILGLSLLLAGLLYAFVLGSELPRHAYFQIYLSYFGAVAIAFAASRGLVLHGHPRWIAVGLMALLMIAMVTFIVIGNHQLGIASCLLFSIENGAHMNAGNRKTGG